MPKKILRQEPIEINGVVFNVYNASREKVVNQIGVAEADKYYTEIDKQVIATNNIDTRLRMVLREWEENFDLTKQIGYFSGPVNKFLRIYNEGNLPGKLANSIFEHIESKRQEIRDANKPAANDNSVVIEAPAVDHGMHRRWEQEMLVAKETRKRYREEEKENVVQFTKEWADKSRQQSAKYAKIRDEGTGINR